MLDEVANIDVLPGGGAAGAADCSMGEVLGIDEIRRRFDSEWVLVQDPEVDQHLRVLGGTVVCHSKARDEVYRKAMELRPKHAAFLYTGEIPEGMAVLL